MEARIAHISYYLPEKKFTNEDFFALFPEMRNNKNLEKTGIVERRIAAENEVASDMALKAAEKLISESGIDRNTIDFLLFSSGDTDYYTPATSMVIHKKLGLDPGCGTLDQTQGCSAFVYGLSAAKGLIAQGAAKNVLVLFADTLTRYLHAKDKASRYLFGDAATAVLVSETKQTGIGQVVFGTVNEGLEKIIRYDGRARHPINQASYEEKEDDYGNITNRASLYMDGIGVFMLSIRHVPRLVHSVLEKNKLALNDIDLFIFHQANYYMIETIAGKLGIPPEKVFNNARLIGNTIGSSIPIALADALAQKKVTPGAKVLVAGFGTGFSLSGTVIVV